MASERTHVDKYLCTVCGHRHSNGWYCKHSIDAKDATIARLEAEVERLQLAVDGEKAVRHMAVCRLGGLVEGRPTHEGNFLQRIDALVRLEAENAALRERADNNADSDRLEWLAEQGFCWRCHDEVDKGWRPGEWLYSGSRMNFRAELDRHKSTLKAKGKGGA